jgi:hypothetical protein
MTDEDGIPVRSGDWERIALGEEFLMPVRICKCHSAGLFEHGDLLRSRLAHDSPSAKVGF